MPKITPGRRYTRAQLQGLIDQATADELKLQGYVLQYDTVSQTYAVVPWHQASQPFRQDGNRAQRRAVKGSSSEFGELAPIVKRTPQERVDSLMLRWIEDMKKAGTIPGVDDAKVKEIVGEAWKAGRTEITADVVRTVAAHFLTEAEAKHEEKLSHQVTRSEA